MRHQYGQSLAEYGIALGLVAVMAIGTLAVLGDTIQGGMNGVFQPFGPQPSPASPAAPTVALASFNPDGPLSPFAKLPGKNVTLDLGNGKVLYLVYPNPTNVAEVAGGNGVTENALAILDQAIFQMEQPPKADPAEIAALKKLSEEGHKIQAIQKALDDATPSDLPTDAAARFNYLQTHFITIADPVTGQPRQVSLMDAGSTLRGKSSDDLSQIPVAEADLRQSNIIKNSSQLYSYLTAVQQVKDSPILQNSPALKDLVLKDLGQQIFDSSWATASAPTKDDIKTLTQTTRFNSNQICTLSNSATCQDRAGS